MDNRSEAYDLGLFGAQAFSTAIPVVDLPDPEPQKKEKPSAKPKVSSAAKTRAESMAETRQALKIFAVILVMFSLFVGILAARLNVYELKALANEKEILLDEAKSENIRLNMALNALMSREKVEDYAVNVLGMQKIERYQIYYFDDRDGDKVVISGGDAVNAEIKADN